MAEILTAGHGADLGAYLGAVLRRRFAYGSLDCCTLMADWLVARGLPDPMADRRGKYATHAEYRAAVRAEGGLLQSCRRRFAAIGLVETARPRPGDVGLVRAIARLGGRRLVRIATGAICLSERVQVVVTPDAGLVGAELEILQAWTVKHA